MQRQAWSLIQTVEFIIAGFRKIGIACFHDDVAGSAGALASAGVFDGNLEVHRDIQNGFGLSVFVVGKLSGFEFHCFVEI